MKWTQAKSVYVLCSRATRGHQSFSLSACTAHFVSGEVKRAADSRGELDFDLRMPVPRQT